MEVYNTKKALEGQDVRKIYGLATSLGVNTKNYNDLLWIIALTIVFSSKKGRMGDGETLAIEFNDFISVNTDFFFTPFNQNVHELTVFGKINYQQILDNYIEKNADLFEIYKDFFDYYMEDGYMNINEFYRTGYWRKFGGEKEILYDLFIKLRNNYDDFNHEIGINDWKSVPDRLKIVLNYLYNKIIPLDYDIVVYRGVYSGVIGRNVFDKTCIVTNFYNLHDYTKLPQGCESISAANFFKNWTPSDNIEKYIYNYMGIMSTSTSFDIIHEFSNDDAVLALLIPKGTKIITSTYEEYKESEIMLFPGHNSFVLYDSFQPVRPLSSPYLEEHYSNAHFYRGFCVDKFGV